jgi:hypothetical protein
LLLFTAVAYLPVLLPFFHLKNDLITQNLPTRYIISESIRSGYFPWWNPYIHYGIPQYGDMNNGFWNPVLWIIAKTIGYNLLTITIEEIFYIFLGGWGIYLLVREFGTKQTAIVTGLTYICCGYIVGHLQHFIWITGTAFFPYVLVFLVRTYKKPLAKHFIATAFAVFMFVSSTHPGLIIGGIYFLLLCTLLIYGFRKSVFSGLYHPKYWFISLILLAASCLLASVVIVSNIDVLRHITRGESLSDSALLLNPTTIQSYLSLFVPLAVNKSSFFHTDISMRNIYIGISGLVGLILFFKCCSKPFLVAIGICLLFFISLSAGGAFKIFYAHFLPGLSYVRLNGEFSYYTLLICLLAGAAGFDAWLHKKIPGQTFNRILKILAGVGTLIFFGAALLVLLKQSSAVYTKMSPSYDFKIFIKTFLDNLTIWDLLIISGLIQAITAVLLIATLKRTRLFILTCSINLIAFTWLCLPFTGLGMKSRHQMQQLITTEPKGIMAPELIAIKHTKYIDTTYRNQLLLLSSYSKKIGSPIEESYPVQLTNSQNYFSDTALREFINRQSWIFLNDDTSIATRTNFDSSRIQVKAFGPGFLNAQIKNDSFRYITFLQNNYPYWQAKIDGKPVPHYTVFKTFIGFPLPTGNHIIEISFDPVPIRRALWLSGLVSMIFLGILFHKRWRNYVLLK